MADPDRFVSHCWQEHYIIKKSIYKYAKGGHKKKNWLLKSQSGIY